jgi:type IV pilus assembly protein PilC
MRFDYQARTKEGELKVGQVEASSYETALDILQKSGYFVTFLEKAEEKPFLAKEIRLFRKIKKKDVIIFTRQLAILLASQVPPVEALHTIGAQIQNQDFKDKILKIAAEVEGGKSFSKALSLYPLLFSRFYINMIKSGEASGDLPKALENLADHLEKEYDLFAKIRGTLLYPAFILGVMVVLLILMFYFIFPELEKIFAETGRELPLITVFLLNFAEFIRSWGIIIFFILLLILAFFLRYIKTIEGRIVFDQVILKIPLINTFLRKIYLARFAKNLSTLIKGGLPIAQALEISAQVAGNNVYRKIILEARDGVRRGESISSNLKRYPQYIPPFVSQMIFVGERIGQLSQTLVRMAVFYEKEVDLAVAKFISLIEPVLIVLLGIVVAFILLAVLLPIYQIGLA